MVFVRTCLCSCPPWGFCPFRACYPLLFLNSYHLPPPLLLLLSSPVTPLYPRSTHSRVYWPSFITLMKLFSHSWSCLGWLWILEMPFLNPNLLDWLRISSWCDPLVRPWMGHFLLCLSQHKPPPPHFVSLCSDFPLAQSISFSFLILGWPFFWPYINFPLPNTPTSTPKRETVCFSRVLVPTYKSMWCYNPEQQHWHFNVILSSPSLTVF
jgi:hypothetical protein